MDHTAEEMQVIFPACVHSPEALQPGKEAFDFPAAFISAERSAILCDTAFVEFMRRDEFNASFFFQALVKRVAVIRFIAQQPFGLAWG